MRLEMYDKTKYDNGISKARQANIFIDEMG